MHANQGTLLFEIMFEILPHSKRKCEGEISVLKIRADCIEPVVKHPLVVILASQDG